MRRDVGVPYTHFLISPGVPSGFMAFKIAADAGEI